MAAADTSDATGPDRRPAPLPAPPAPPALPQRSPIQHSPPQHSPPQASPQASPRRASPPELARLNPRVRLAWWVQAAVVAVLATALTSGAAFLLGFAPPALMALLVGPPAAVAAGVLPALRYRRWRYALDANQLWLCFGVVRATVSVIPLSRLQFVDTRQGPLDRALGLARLVVHTAALGTSGVLPGLDAAEAACLRDRLAAAQRDAGV